MTKGEARKELKSYQKYIAIREARSRRIEELRGMLYGCKVSKFGGRGGGKNAYRMEETIDNLTKVEAEYVDAVKKSAEILAKIEGKVEQLSGVQYAVLRGHYIEGKSYELLAVEMHYSYQHVCKSEQRGVDAYATL